MKRVVVYLALTAAVIASGCQGVNESTLAEQPQQGDAHVLNGFIPDEGLLPYVSIKVNEEMAAQFEALADSTGYISLPELKSLPTNGIVRMRRLFQHGGKYEAQMREYGLHQWYKVEYDEAQSVTKGGFSLDVPGVELIEFNPRIEIVGNPKIVEVALPRNATPTATAPFDDPRLKEQWSYYNDGSAFSSTSGCDVNVYPVWRNYKTGSEDIIVGVVDTGIDFNHEDLADNMWINPEKKGDNRFGYNFATGSFTVNPQEHGTHVAGTIAAVNNNGIGVCGIAGGDAKKKVKGVRIMSCQIFDGQKQGSGAEAIVWSRNNGAIISQNSWGSTVQTSTSAALKSAVDYFTDKAGYDENGMQVGPMAGGIVIFAAGNDNSILPYGSDYERMFIVASVGADYRRAYYSNYGPWVHISAPGGDAKKGNQILSTIPGNKYGLSQGTSMACPHVSGVAALILANKMAKGFKSSDLRKLMTDTAVDIQSVNKGVGMGAGLINAYGAIAGSGGKAPGKPSVPTLTAQSNNVTCSVSIPADEDDGTPSAIYVYYSTSDFSKTSDAAFAMFYVGDEAKAGDVLTGKIKGLEFNTKYYMAAQAADLAGNRSALTSRVQVTTGGNNSPVLTRLGEATVSIKPHEKASMPFSIEEPDGHWYTIELKQGSTGTELDTLTRNLPKIVVTGANAASGTYKDTLVVTDYYGLTVQDIVEYTILENHKPYKGKELEDMVFSKNDPVLVLNASEYFKDDDGEELSYKIDFSNVSVCNMTYASGKFHITPMNYGNASITVEGKDVRGETVEQSFRILIRDNSKPVEVYPNPVSTKLNIRAGEAGTWHVKIIASSGAVFFEGDLEIDPFNPPTVDMSKAAPGVYTVVLTKDGQELKYVVVKI